MKKVQKKREKKPTQSKLDIGNLSNNIKMSLTYQL